MSRRTRNDFDEGEGFLCLVVNNVTETSHGCHYLCLCDFIIDMKYLIHAVTAVFSEEPNTSPAQTQYTSH